MEGIHIEYVWLYFFLAALSHNNVVVAGFQDVQACLRPRKRASEPPQDAKFNESFTQLSTGIQIRTRRPTLATQVQSKKPKIDTCLATMTCIENLPSFQQLSTDEKETLLLMMEEKYGGKEAKCRRLVCRNLTTMVSTLKTTGGHAKRGGSEKVSNAAVKFRMAITASVISYGSSATSELSNVDLGRSIGLGPMTVSTTEECVGDRQDLAHVRILEYSPTTRKDCVDYPGSPVKALCQDYVIIHTRASPDPGDTVLQRCMGRRVTVSCRYLPGTRTQLHHQFIRDMRQLAIVQNPKVSLTDYTLVSKSVFFKWLHEWKFIRDEVWYVCICFLCYNILEYLKVYFALTRKVHGVTRRMSGTVPIRKTKTSSTLENEEDDELSELDDDENVAECHNPSCMTTSMRTVSQFQVPREGSDDMIEMKTFDGQPTVLEWLTRTGILCPHGADYISGYSCAKGACDKCGIERVFSAQRYVFCTVHFNFIFLDAHLNIQIREPSISS